MPHLTSKHLLSFWWQAFFSFWIQTVHFFFRLAFFSSEQGLEKYITSKRFGSQIWQLFLLFFKKNCRIFDGSWKCRWQTQTFAFLLFLALVVQVGTSMVGELGWRTLGPPGFNWFHWRSFLYFLSINLRKCTSSKKSHEPGVKSTCILQREQDRFGSWNQLLWRFRCAMRTNFEARSKGQRSQAGIC